MSKTTRAISPKVQFQVVVEALAGTKTSAQIAEAYGVHPNSVGLWKKLFLERGPGIFARASGSGESARRIAELEQLPGREEVEIALLENFLGHRP